MSKRNRENETPPIPDSSIVCNFDLVFSPRMGEKFIDLYAPVHTDLKSVVVNNICNPLLCLLQKVVENRSWEHRDIRYKMEQPTGPYSIGDLVKVSYSPDSQKYIDHYDERGFTGRIIFVDAESDNMFFVCKTDDSNKIIIRSLEVEGCHYFGTCRSYVYHIDPVLSESKRRKQ